MDISKVLDDAREKMNLTSDYELAKRLEIDKADISHYRKGKRIPNAYACARLAEVLDMDPFELLAQVEAATEKNEARRSYWRAVAERIAAGTVAGFFVVAVLANDVGFRLLTVIRSWKSRISAGIHWPSTACKF